MSKSEASLEQARIALTEFQALRTEIGNRSTAQYTLVGINLVATSTLGGIALGSDKGSPNVLLLIAPVCVATGLLWLDHAHAIYQIGTYIKRELWHFLSKMMAQLQAPDKSSLPSYENYAVEGKPLLVERSIFLLPFFLVFVAPPIFSAVYLLGRRHQGWIYFGLMVDLILDASLVLAWVLALRQFWRRMPPVRPAVGAPAQAGPAV